MSETEGSLPGIIVVAAAAVFTVLVVLLMDHVFSNDFHERTGRAERRAMQQDAARQVREEALKVQLAKTPRSRGAGVVPTPAPVQQTFRSQPSIDQLLTQSAPPPAHQAT